jgi:hypothetical protein
MTCSENLKARDKLGNGGIDGRLIQILREIGCEGVYCIQLALDKAQWLTFLNMAMNISVP